MASQPTPSPQVTLHKGEFTMDDLLNWKSNVSVTEGQQFTTPKPGPKQMIFSIFHMSEFPFGGGVPQSPLPLSSAQAKAMDQAVIVPDEFEIKPIDSKNPDALQNRRHRTSAHTAFSWDGNQLKRLGFYAQVTSTEFLLKNNDVLQIGGLKDEATSQCIQNSPNLPIFNLVNSWRFGGGKYLGAAEGKSWGPYLLGPFGLLLGLAVGGKPGATVGGTLGTALGGKVGAAVGGKAGELFTPPNYASCSTLVIPPTDTLDGALLAKTTYQPLANHHFGFEFCMPKWTTRFVMTKASTTNNPAEAIHLKSDTDAFRIAHKDGTITSIKVEEAIEIAKQHNVLGSVDSFKAIENKSNEDAMNHYLQYFNQT